MYRLNNYLDIRELCGDQKPISRSRFDLQIEEALHLQVELLSADGKLCTDQKLICRSKNYMQIEDLSTNGRVICKSKNYENLCDVF